MTAVGRQAARSEATRRKLLRAARKLFARRGYAATSINDVLRATGVSRGALYHHFPGGKEELFLAVYEEVDIELVERLRAAAEAEPDLGRHLEIGCQAFVDACLDPAVRRIVLVDAPSVLTWERWREIEGEHGMGLIGMALTIAMDHGAVRRQPVAPLTALLFGALIEAGQLIARSDDVEAAREEVRETITGLLEGLAPR